MSKCDCAYSGRCEREDAGPEALADHGGPAYPIPGGLCFGMTVRQRYKEAAIRGILPFFAKMFHYGSGSSAQVAEIAGEIADASLAEDKEAAERG